MRLLTRLILIVAIVAALGLYFGWFHIGTESGDGKSKVTFTVDREKIEQDKDKVMDKTIHPATQTAARP